jgi:hypothetical protein
MSTNEDGEMIASGLFLFDKLKPIFDLPDRVTSMSIEINGPGVAELKLTTLITLGQAGKLAEELQVYRLEKKGSLPWPPAN